MISVKNLAEELGISTQAVYKYFKKYPELKAHKKGSDLDDEAANFIRSKSKPNPVIVVNQDNLDKIEEYRTKYEKQLEKTAELAQSLSKALENAAANEKLIANAVTLKKENGELKIKLQTSEDAVNELKPLIQTVDDLNKKVNELETQIEYLNNLSLIQLIKYKLKKKK